jgi:type IV pilus assembly protein PilC
VEKLALSRFARNFSLLLASGVDILKVLSLLRQVVGNSVLAAEIDQIRSRVMTGETLAASLSDNERFPILMRRLIAVGEGTGRLEETLSKSAQHLDKEMPRRLKQLFTFTEVIMVLLIGSLIVTTALAMLLPIFNIQGELLK